MLLNASELVEVGMSLLLSEADAFEFANLEWATPYKTGCLWSQPTNNMYASTFFQATKQAFHLFPLWILRREVFELFITLNTNNKN